MAETLFANKSLLVCRHSCPPLSTNTYLFACLQQRQAVIIDPGFESLDHLSSFLKENDLQLQALWLTHSHWDHIAEVATWYKNYSIPVYLHPLDAPNLIQPGSDQLPMPMFIDSHPSTQPLQDGQQLTVGTTSFSVIHTPGHSPGGVCLYNANASMLFSGDTLFRGTIGKVNFPTSQPKLMWPSLHTLSKLPPLTIVYPGHGETTTIAAESWLSKAEKIFSR